LWYNFIFADGSINKEYQTSVASFGWWAVRGLRGLGAGYRIFTEYADDGNLTAELSARFKSSQPHLDSLFSVYPQNIIMDDGSERPAWNLKNAPDQSAELLLALAGVHGLADFDYLEEIRYLADALIGWQYVGDQKPYIGMYYCWQNTWHSWGNNQALALVTAYEITGEESYLTSVKLWADNFVPALLRRDHLAEITYDPGGEWQVSDFPQIAYGINSTYRGIKALADHEISDYYTALADHVFSWFEGENIAHTIMYDHETGRCFDGIISPQQVNQNSGAESTIECLLAIQARGGW